MASGRRQGGAESQRDDCEGFGDDAVAARQAVPEGFSRFWFPSRRVGTRAPPTNSTLIQLNQTELHN